MGVHPNYRGKGFGKSILLLLEKEAKYRGLKKCSLTVDPFNEKAIYLYFLCGFEITGYKTAYFSSANPNSDRFWMEKNLDSPKQTGKQSLNIRVDNIDLLKSTIQKKYIGIKLIRSANQNCKHNFIVFRKPYAQVK